MTRVKIYAAPALTWAMRLQLQHRLGAAPTGGDRSSPAPAPWDVRERRCGGRGWTGRKVERRSLLKN